MIEEASGTVAITSSTGDMLGTQPGTQLVAPFTIKTGSDGRVVVSHRLDKLTVGENSQSTVAVPKHDKGSVFTLIKQKLGSVLYEVEHRVKDNFEVDTPYLVSVVKGTTFNIHVTQNASSVSLIEGRVLVYTPDKKSELMLTPGQAAIKSIHSKGILLKDQQSLSQPVQGRITVVKDGKATVVSPEASNSRASTARARGLEKAPLSDIGSPDNMDRGLAAARKGPETDGSMIDIGASAARVPVGSGAAAVGLGTSVSGVAKGTGLSAGSAVNLGANAPGLSTGAAVGGGGVANVGASVPGVSTGANISNSGTVNLTTSVPGASAGVNAGAGGVSVGTGTGSSVSNAVKNVSTTLTTPGHLLGQ